MAAYKSIMLVISALCSLHAVHLFAFELPKPSSAEAQVKYLKKKNARLKYLLAEYYRERSTSRKERHYKNYPHQEERQRKGKNRDRNWPEIRLYMDTGEIL